jgi:hypothetical protein
VSALIAALFLLVFAATLNALASQLPGKRLSPDWRHQPRHELPRRRRAVSVPTHTAKAATT